MTKILTPDSDRYIRAAHEMVDALLNSSQDKKVIFAFLINSLYKFSEGVINEGPFSLQNTPCSSFRWVTVAMEINKKVSVYVNSSNPSILQ